MKEEETTVRTRCSEVRKRKLSADQAAITVIIINAGLSTPVDAKQPDYVYLDIPASRTRNFALQDSFRRRPSHPEPRGFPSLPPPRNWLPAARHPGKS